MKKLTVRYTTLESLDRYGFDYDGFAAGMAEYEKSVRLNRELEVIEVIDDCGEVVDYGHPIRVRLNGVYFYDVMLDEMNSFWSFDGVTYDTEMDYIEILNVPVYQTRCIKAAQAAKQARIEEAIAHSRTQPDGIAFADISEEEAIAQPDWSHIDTTSDNEATQPHVNAYDSMDHEATIREEDAPAAYYDPYDTLFLDLSEGEATTQPDEGAIQLQPDTAATIAALDAHIAQIEEAIAALKKMQATIKAGR